ncbi:MAG: tetratricopeptide repeat protein [Fibrobacter sp.]|nr:tetratricopeptide repeat protein [Fibrobacter sp.]
MRFLTFMMLFLAMQVSARPLDKGNKFYQKEEYGEALEQYLAARTEQPDNRLLSYNIGTTYYQLGQYDNAIAELQDALRAGDSAVVRQAAFNLGNAHYRQGQGAQKPADRIAAWREAIAWYKKAIDLQPNYENSKRNVEIVMRRLKEELDKNKQDQNPEDQDQEERPPMSEAAKAALARALQLTNQGAYYEAKAVLEPVITTDDTAEPLKPYLQRIEDVIDISEGREPARPLDQSNHEAELGVI